MTPLGMTRDELIDYVDQLETENGKLRQALRGVDDVFIALHKRIGAFINHREKKLDIPNSIG